jgi:hypothetical protein
MGEGSRDLGRRYASLGPLYGLLNYKKREMAMGSGMKSVQTSRGSRFRGAR